MSWLQKECLCILGLTIFFIVMVVSLSVAFAADEEPILVRKNVCPEHTFDPHTELQQRKYVIHFTGEYKDENGQRLPIFEFICEDRPPCTCIQGAPPQPPARPLSPFGGGSARPAPISSPFRSTGQHGAPGPVIGAGLPVAAVGFGIYWLIRRRRK